MAEVVVRCENQSNATAAVEHGLNTRETESSTRWRKLQAQRLRVEKMANIRHGFGRKGLLDFTGNTIVKIERAATFPFRQ